nr:immunoglobulin light chain junction region [Macaca mulatta]MOV71020.1 immunoglobulin light chain junction region [Macaca mulatta]
DYYCQTWDTGIVFF